jgi:hypothetical protein
MNLRTMAAGLVTCWALTGSAAAQPPYGAGQQGGPGDLRRAAPERGRGAHRARDVLGAQIRLRDGYSVGTVSDMVFNDDGYLEYVVVETAGRNVLVPWSAARFNFEGRAATLDVPRDRWRDVPTLDRWPDLGDAGYRARVSRYYGVPAVTGQPGRDLRTVFVLDDADGYYQNQGGGNWARYLNGRFDRMYRETGRTPDFIELLGQDNNGNAVLDRLYNASVEWKLQNAEQWNRAHTGRWRLGSPAVTGPAARDVRTLFVLDDADGYYQSQGDGKWARYLNGRFDRMYRETGRTPDCIELLGQDDNGNAVLDRLCNASVDWKLQTAEQWNRAHTGRWRVR